MTKFRQIPKSLRKQLAHEKVAFSVRMNAASIAAAPNEGVTHNFLSRSFNFKGTTKLDILTAAAERLRVMAAYKNGGSAMYYCQGSEWAVTQWSKVLEDMKLREYAICSPVSRIALDATGIVDPELADPRQGLIQCNTPRQFERRMAGVGLSAWWREKMEGNGYPLHKVKVRKDRSPVPEASPTNSASSPS